MMKEQELILPGTRGMGATDSMQSAHSSSRSVNKTVEALTGLLQEMAVTIQTLANRYNAVCQNYQSCSLPDADLSTSLSNGLSMSLELPPAAVNLSPTQSRNRDSIPPSPLSSRRQVSGSHLPKRHYPEASLLRTQEEMNIQGDHTRSSAVSLNGTCGSDLQQEVKTRKTNNGVINLDGQGRNWICEPKCGKRSLDAKTVDALRCFLEEMKTTIQVWSIRHRLLSQSHENAGMPESAHVDLASREVEAVVNTNQPTNGRAFALGSNQLPAKIDSGFREQFETPAPDDQFCRRKSGGSQHIDHLNGESLKVVEQCPPKVDHLRVCDRGGDCLSVPKERRDEPEKCVSAISGEGMLPVATPRVVKVVESPDWLPFGWITEVKTRTGGNSAGTKDKYYFDPVSKRRFRSRKEVFCFLTTGKLGRYKPKPKALCNEDASNRDCISSGQTTGTYPFLNKQNRLIQSLLPPLLLPSHVISSISYPSSFCSSPGFSSDFFVPCIPSSRPDWLKYANIINLSAPVHKNFQWSQPDAVIREGFRLFNEPCPAASRSFSSAHCETPVTVSNGMLGHHSHGSHMLETAQNHFSEACGARAGIEAMDGAGCGSSNMKGLHDDPCPLSSGVGQAAQPKDSGAVLSDGGGNSRSQLACSNVPKKVETNWLGKGLRYSVHDHGVGLKLPTKKLKKGKSHGKKVLEALGRVVCQQGLSFLQRHKPPNVHT